MIFTSYNCPVNLCLNLSPSAILIDHSPPLIFSNKDPTHSLGSHICTNPFSSSNITTFSSSTFLILNRSCVILFLNISPSMIVIPYCSLLLFLMNQETSCFFNCLWGLSFCTFLQAISSHCLILFFVKPQISPISPDVHGSSIKQQQFPMARALSVIWILAKLSLNPSQNRLWGHL